MRAGCRNRLHILLDPAPFARCTKADFDGQKVKYTAETAPAEIEVEDVFVTSETLAEIT